MPHSSDSRRALLWLVSAFGAVAVARYDAFAHPSAAAEVVGEADAAVRASGEGDALRDGRPIALNRASSAELELLPGVGPSLARRLVEARERDGPYRRAEDLLRVRGVGKKTLEKLAPFLSFELEELEHPAQTKLRLRE